MQKILLIGINARYSHPCVALYYLRTYVQDLYPCISIQEFTIRNTPEEIITYIEAQNPGAVGFSVYIWNSKTIKQLLKLIPRNKHYYLFLGGPEVSYNADEWLCEFPCVDYIITGHGEEGFRRLIQSAFFMKDNIVRSMNPPFSEIPFPYSNEDFAAFAHKNLYYESSRGCPFSCAYCISSCSDQKLEFRELAQVKTEIERIMKYSPKLVKFIDRTFNARPERARKIWEMIMDCCSGMHTTFHFEIHPMLLSDKDFEVLRKARKGLFQFEIGIQSTHSSVLNEIGRKGEWERERNALAMLMAMGNIRLHVDLIAGLPGENFNLFGVSFNRVYAIGAEHFQLGILKVLPGTRIKNDAARYELEFNQHAPYEVLRNKWLSTRELHQIKKIAWLVDALYNSKKFPCALKELGAQFTTPWDMYLELSRNFTEELRDRDWATLYTLLREFIEKIFFSERAFFRDCLAYDWFMSFSTNRIPSLLKREGYRYLRNKIMALIKRTNSLSAKTRMDDYARARMFIPESEMFREKYLSGGVAVVFFQNGSMEIIMPDSDYEMQEC